MDNLTAAAYEHWAKARGIEELVAELTPLMSDELLDELYGYVQAHDYYVSNLKDLRHVLVEEGTDPDAAFSGG